MPISLTQLISLNVGRFPFFVSRTSADSSSSDIRKENSSVADGCPKHSCNCLGRDTIANAAACVGPAVVNLSVPKGIFQDL